MLAVFWNYIVLECFLTSLRREKNIPFTVFNSTLQLWTNIQSGQVWIIGWFINQCWNPC
jgi:hypothetical protein